jgi:hypothetical protein
MTVNMTTIEDLIHDEEGLGVVRDAIDLFRHHWGQPDTTDAEALVAIARSWLDDSHDRLVT